ncbi:GldG family protein [soil metagenome]
MSDEKNPTPKPQSSKLDTNRSVFSVIGVVAVLVIVIALNYIAREVPLAADFTEDDIHTLSEGTERILEKIDTPVQLKLYVTQDSDVVPPQLETQVREVEALLSQYVRESGGRVTLQKYDPQPDTDEEDAARLAGMQANRGPRGDIYFGISVSSIDQKATLPFLPAISEELLEYELTRAISQVANPEKTVIGVMSSYQLSGGGGMPPQMGGRPTEPWIAYNELASDFEIRNLPQDVEAIESEINVLVLLHPAELTESAQFAIDQFVLRGGKLAAFLDPYSITARITQPQPNPMMQQPPAGTPQSSNMEKLLSTWGLTFNDSSVVADLTYKTPLQGGRQAPAVLTLPAGAINQDDVLTSQINDIWLVFAGEFTGTPAEGLTQEILLTSSEVSQLVDPMTAESEDDAILDSFRPSGEEKTLGLRLTGKFKTAFPDGKPAPPAEPGETGGEGQEEADDDDAPEAADSSLKESAADGVVILIGDSDLLYDQFCVRVQNFFGQRLASPINGNLILLQNIVEQLSGDTDLIAIRSRASTRRPFTRVNEIEEEAMAKIRERLQKLDNTRQEAESRLNELQAQKDPSQQSILTAEQQAEIQKFQEEAVAAGKERRELQKSARREVNSLIARIKAINIFAVPVLVAVVGLGVFLVRRRKTMAR